MPVPTTTQPSEPVIYRVDGPLSAQDAVYTERAALVAFLTKVYPAYLARDPDEADPAFQLLVVVETPEGQLAWHIATADRSLFPHLKEAPHRYDGHTTAQKYERLSRLNPPKAKFTLPQSTLQALRKRRGKSLTEVALRTGISRSYLSTIERGESTNPSLDVLRRLAKYYKVPVRDLIDDLVRSD